MNLLKHPNQPTKGKALLIKHDKMNAELMHTFENQTFDWRRSLKILNTADFTAVDDTLLHNFPN